jgi:hypothetical protein
MTSNVARVALAASLALVAWRVVHVNAGVYGDTNRPVTSAPAGAGPSQAAVAALRANPADVRALLVVARERDQRGDAAGTAAAYDAALAIAPIERVALHEAAASDLRNGRVAEALRRMDALASHYDDSRPAIYPVLGQMLARPVDRALVEENAARNPEWLAQFLEYACSGLEPQHFAGLFMRRAAGGKATVGEVRCVTDRLRRAGHWALAYQAWLNSLPRARLADVGHVFNGGFEHPSSGVGFDWIAAEDAVQSVEFSPARGAGGERALRVGYSGKRIAGPAIRQHLALPPGRYQFTGRVRLDGLASVRGVQWALRCGLEAGATPIAATERFLGTEPWRPFTAAVTVPAAGCPGQVLSLEPVGQQEGTTFVSGAAFFDDLRMVRAR